MILNEQLLDKAKTKFASQFDCEASAYIVSPGRVNLIGEHIDYCGGSVLPMTIDQASLGLVALNQTNSINIYSERFSEMDRHQIGEIDKQAHWADFARGVEALISEQYTVSGFDLYVQDDIAAGGLSSSASFCLLLCWAYLYCAGVTVKDADRMALAQLAQKVENQYLGVACGMMDQASIAIGGAIYLDCQSLEYKPAQLDLGGYTWVIMDTGIARTLAASKYNERVSEVEALMQLLQPYYQVDNLASLPFAQLNTILQSIEDATLVKRLRHIMTEVARVKQFAIDMGRGLLVDAGKLLNQSHDSLRDDYEVSCEGLDQMVELARCESSCLGARMTGAGFGGCAIALVEKSAVKHFVERVTAGYEKVSNVKPTLLATGEAKAVALTTF